MMSRQGMRLLLMIVCIFTLLGVSRDCRGEGERCSEARDLKLCIETSFPKQGEECRISVIEGGAPVRGARIRVTYRPNSEVETREALGATDAAGTLIWTPTEAGIATLEAGLSALGAEDDPSSLSLTVPVKFKTSPALGILILLLAGMILFGGNGYSFAKTFGRK